MSEAMKMGRGFWVTVEGCDSCGVISSDGCPFTNLDSYSKWVDEHDEEDFHPDCPLEREQPKLDIDIDGYAGEATRLIYTVWPKDAAWSGPKVKDLMVNFLTHLRPIPSIGIDEAVAKVCQLFSLQCECNGYDEGPTCDACVKAEKLKAILTRYQADEVRSPASCGECTHKRRDCPFFIDNEYRMKSRAVFVSHHPGEIYAGCPFYPSPDTVAVLEKLEKEVAVVFSELECTCIDAYKGRNLVDPGCVACDVESLVEEVKNLIAKAKGER